MRNFNFQTCEDGFVTAISSVGNPTRVLDVVTVAIDIVVNIAERILKKQLLLLLKKTNIFVFYVFTEIRDG